MQINKSDADRWWDSTDYETKQLAFYSVIDKMRQVELMDKGSYRYAIYDVFGFRGDMYGPGIECGYMDLHNTIANVAEQDGLSEVKKIIIADEQAGDYERRVFPTSQRLRVSLEDDQKTFKITVQSTEPFNE